MSIQLLMTGLLIQFRQPGTPMGLLLMVEMCNAMCGAMMVAAHQLAIMSTVPHEDVAVDLALLSLATSVGVCVGQTISAVLWTNTVERRIGEYLLLGMKDQSHAIYSDLKVRLGLSGRARRDRLL
jgi:hypothetical protein